MANEKPEIHGPDAATISASIPDGIGHSLNEGEEVPEGVAEALAQAIAAAAETEKVELDPMFPFGTPDQIDYKELDQAGVKLIQELNKRPWIKTVEYCSGHPLNRHPEEASELYPYVTGENVYEETDKLDMAFIRGVVPDQFFRRRKRELREQGLTRFYLNVNVYSLPIFMDWVRTLAAAVMVVTQQGLNPLIIRFNPIRTGVNYSIYWDYWTLEERDLIHNLALDTLNQIPI